MTLLQMKYITEVERFGSINRAAQSLLLTQSALSNAIGEAEKELGICIFKRTNRGVILTEDGRTLVSMIRPVLEGSRKITSFYREQCAEKRIHLSVASQRYPFCAQAFVEYLHTLSSSSIDLRFKEMDMSEVISEVSSQVSQLGVIFVSDLTETYIRKALDDKHLEFHPMSAVRPRVFMRRGHPLANEESLRLEQLYPYPYTMFTQNNTNLNFAEEAVACSPSEFRQVIYVSDRATIYNVMAHTDCVSTGSGVLPEGYGDDRLISVPLTGNISEMRIGYVHLRGVPLTKVEEDFIEILQDILSKI